jgi:hypothetical protein
VTVQDAKTIRTMCSTCYGPVHEGSCPEPHVIKPVVIDIKSIPIPDTE